MAGRGAIPVQLSSDFKAAIRHDYVETDKPVREICAEFGISVGKISRLIVNENWPRRTDRPPRELPPALKLREKARVLVARSSPPPERGRSDREAIRVGVNDEPSQWTPSPTLPLSGGGSDGAAPVSENESPDTAARIEALVLKELAAEEAARTQLGAAPRNRVEADKIARTLAAHTQTLQHLRRLRAGQTGAPPEQPGPIDHDDDMPADLDEFRYELARRIRAFVDSRTGRGDAERDPDATLVDAARP